MRGLLITLKPFCFATETVVSKSFSDTCPFGSNTDNLPAGFIASRPENPYPLSGKVNAIPGSDIYLYLLCYYSLKKDTFGHTS